MPLRFRQWFMILVSVIAIAYILYRGLFTLNLSTSYATFASLLLYVAELYGVLNMLLYFLQVWDTYEPPQQPVLENRTVDVFVPTYNEDPDLLRATLQACVRMDYPHRTFLCDDGGTDQRINDPEKGKAARERSDKLKAICAELGVIYSTRPKNLHAKAGNLNYAFEKTDGEFIIIFDADHVPEPNFITRLLGYFADEKLAFVQTPHAFYNFDSFQARLNHGKRRYWEEGQLFYHVIQPGRNRWNAPIFAGSAAMFRRSALKEVGYIAMETITEDMHTGLRMHAKGWKSLGISERLICGQAAPDVTTFHTQRLRWGEGNLSVLAYDNPITLKGLSWGQRLCYFATMINWAGGIFKLGIYLTPLLMLFTGIPPVNGFTWTLAIFTFVYMLGCILGTKVAGNGYGSFWYSELFTMASFWTQVRSTFRAVFWRKFQSFVVTSKRGRQDNSIWPYIRPQVYLILVSAAALLWAWSRPVFHLTGDIYKPMLATFWACFHMVLAYLVIRRAFWPEERRFSYRHAVNLPVQYQTMAHQGESIQGLGTTADLNETGVCLISYQPLGVGSKLRLTISGTGESITLEGEIRWSKESKPTIAGAVPAQGYRNGIKFLDPTPQQVDVLVRMCMHYAIPKLYREYATSHQKSLWKPIHRWIAQHFFTQRFDPRHHYRIPMTVNPRGSETSYASVTEDMNRTAIAMILEDKIPLGQSVDFQMATPLGELRGNGKVVRHEKRVYAARTYYLNAVSMDHFENDGRNRFLELTDSASERKLAPILVPDKQRMPVPMNRPMTVGAIWMVFILALEFGMFRFIHRDDFFLAEIANASQTISPDNVARVEILHRSTMAQSYADTDRLVLLSQAWMRLDRPTEVAQVMKILAPRDPNNLDLQLALAYAHDFDEEFDNSAEKYTRLLQELDAGKLPESRREEVLAGAARSAVRLGDIELASERFEQLLRLKPDNMTYRNEYAGALSSAREFDRAAALYENVEPDYDGHVLLVLIHTGSKNWKLAEREAREILRQRPNDPTAEGVLADLLAAKGDFQQAKAIYDRLLKAGIDELRFGLQLANASLWNRNYDEALERFQTILAKHGSNPKLFKNFPYILKGYINAAASATELSEVQRRTFVGLYDRILTSVGNDLTILARLGWVLHRLGEEEKSLAVIDRVMEQNPSDSGTRRQVASVLASLGRTDDALKLLQNDLTDIEAHQVLIDVYLAAKNFDLAEKEARYILEQSPNDRAIRIRLADILSWKKEYAAAISQFEELAKEEPEEMNFRIRIAEITLWSGNYTIALHLFETLLEERFDRPSLWWNFVDSAGPIKALTANQKYLARRIVAGTLQNKHQPSNKSKSLEFKEIPYLTRLAWIAMHHLDDSASANQFLDKLVKLPPQDPNERRELVGVFAASKRFPDALTIYQGLTLTLDDYLPLARIHAAAGDHASAAQQCREYLYKRPKDEQAQRLLADYLTWQGNYAEALKWIDKLLVQSRDTDLLLRRAEALLWSGNTAEALKNLTELLAMTPNETRIWSSFLDAAGRSESLSAKEVQLATQLAERVASEDNKDLELLIRTAWVAYKHLKDPVRTETLLYRASLTDTNDPLVKTRLAWAFYNTGDEKKSKQLLEEILQSRPDKSNTLREIVRLLCAMNRFGDAKPILEELTQKFPNDSEFQLRLTETLLGTGEYFEAMSRIETALENDPKRPEHWRSFVDASAALSELSKSQTNLAIRAADQPFPSTWSSSQRVIYCSRLAWTLYREGERTKVTSLTKLSQRILDKAIVLKNLNREARIELSRVMLVFGRFKDALAGLREDAEAHPDDREMQLRYAEALLWGGEKQQGVAQFEKLLQSDWKDTKLWQPFIDGVAGLDKGLLTSSQLNFVSKIASEPIPEEVKEPESYLSRLAWIFIREEAKDRAKPILEKLIALEPKDRKIRQELVGLLTAAGQFLQASHLLEEEAKEHPNDPTIQIRLVELSFWSGFPARTIETLTTMFRTNLNQPLLWSLWIDATSPLTRGTMTREQIQFSLSIAEKPVPKEVKEPTLYRARLAWTLFREGFGDKIKDLVEPIVRETPTVPNTRREVAELLQAIGRSADALRMYEGLTLGTEDYVRLAALYSAAKNFVKAEYYCRELLRERPNDRLGNQWLANVLLWAAKYPEAATRFETLLNEKFDRPELWPNFIEALAKTDQVSKSQQLLASRIAKESSVRESKESLFLTHLAWVLYRTSPDSIRKTNPIPQSVTSTGLSQPIQGGFLVALQRDPKQPWNDFLDRAFTNRPTESLITSQMAMIVYRMGDHKRAGELLDEAIRNSPDELAVQRIVGEALIATNRSDRALGWFEKMVESFPNDTELPSRLAEVTVWAGKYRLGLQRIEKRLDEKFDQPPLWRAYADATSSVKEMTSSQIALAKRIAEQSLPPEWTTNEKTLFFSRIAWGLYRETERIQGELRSIPFINNLLDRALELRAKDANVRIELAGVLAATRRYKEAAAMYEELYREFPNDLSLRIQLAKIAAGMGRTSEAIDQLASLLKDDFHQPTLWQLYVDACASQERLSAAQLRLFDRILLEAINESAPVSLWARAGLIQFREGKNLNEPRRIRSGNEILDRLMKMTLTTIEERKAVAGLLSTAGRNKQALELLRDIELTTKEDRLFLVDISIGSQDWTGAERELRSLLRPSPDDLELQYRLANVLSWSKQYKEARELYTKLENQKPTDERFPLRLAEVSLWSGNYDQALVRYSQLFDKDPTRVEWALSFVDSAAGIETLDPKYRQTVLKACNVLVRQSSNDTNQLLRMAWVMRRLGEHEQSVSMLRKAHELNPTSREIRLQLAKSLTESGAFNEADMIYRSLLRK